MHVPEATCARAARCCVAVLGGLALSACGAAPYEPPPRTADVVAEEARVEELLERRGLFGIPDATCSVRLLGREGPSTFVWSTCTATGSEGVESGRSGPVRIDGTRVREPEDGSGYEPSIRAMFPDALAEAVLEGRDGLRP
jgi:hypothetical protein